MAALCATGQPAAASPIRAESRGAPRARAARAVTVARSRARSTGAVDPGGDLDTADYSSLVDGIN
jgi:hypothetical protein